jgi:hypothetical protein
MKYFKIVLIAITFLSYSNINAQNESKIRFHLRGGLGGNYSIACGDFGVNANIGGYTEFALSEKHKGWKLNIGTRLNNKNFAWINTNTNVSLLFLDIPLLFAYDFSINSQKNIRLEFGPYYSQYIAGALFSQGTNIGSAFYKGYYTPCNVGIMLGGGIWHNDFYFGANLDFIFDLAGEDAFPAFYMTAGYRF